MENYEFNEKQNNIFKLLYTRMQFVGVTFVTVGILISLFSILIRLEVIEMASKFNILAIIFSVFLIITGILLIRASLAFKKIIKTQGEDIDILMNAVRDLYLAFDIQMWMILIAIFFILIMSIFIRDFIDLIAM